MKFQIKGLYFVLNLLSLVNLKTRYRLNEKYARGIVYRRLNYYFIKQILVNKGKSFKVHTFKKL